MKIPWTQLQEHDYDWQKWANICMFYMIWNGSWQARRNINDGLWYLEGTHIRSYLSGMSLEVLESKVVEAMHFCRDSMEQQANATARHLVKINEEISKIKTPWPLSLCLEVGDCS